MNAPFKRIALALAIGLVSVQVFSVAADLLVCLDDRPDRRCCDSPATSDTRADAVLRLGDGADCTCCVRVHVVSSAVDATAHKVKAGWLMESVALRGHVAPVVRCVTSVDNQDPDNPQLSSLRTVVLLI